VGLFLDWFVLWWLYFRGRVHDVRTEPTVNPVQIEQAVLLKAGIVVALVLAGFLAGFSPAMVASLGAAVLLNHLLRLFSGRLACHASDAAVWLALAFLDSMSV
jgi:hypothetical protein